jgi:hypothetical protein
MAVAKLGNCHSVSRLDNLLLSLLRIEPVSDSAAPVSILDMDN